MKRALVGIAVCAFIGGLVRFGEAALPDVANAQLRTAGRSPSNVAARALTADTATSATSATTATTATTALNLNSANFVYAQGYRAIDAGTTVQVAYGWDIAGSTTGATGLYMAAANTLGISAGNNDIVTVESNSFNVMERLVMAATKPIFASDGTAVAPSYSFGNAQTTGFHAVTGAIIGASAAIQFNPAATAQPACVVGLRGVIWYTPGGAGVADEIEICAKSAADAYAWLPLDAPIP